MSLGSPASLHVGLLLFGIPGDKEKAPARAGLVIRDARAAWSPAARAMGLPYNFRSEKIGAGCRGLGPNKDEARVGRASLTFTWYWGIGAG
jgi:hypothetical protein